MVSFIFFKHINYFYLMNANWHLKYIYSGNTLGLSKTTLYSLLRGYLESFLTFRENLVKILFHSCTYMIKRL